MCYEHAQAPFVRSLEDAQTLQIGMQRTVFLSAERVARASARISGVERAPFNR